MITRLLILYGAGSAGAAINTLAVWFAGKSGLISAMHSSLSTSFILPAVYLRLVWGGLWGLTCLLPGLSRLRWMQVGLLISLFPTAAQLLYFFPEMGFGYFGLAKGVGTPVVVFLATLIWGMVTALLARRAM